MGKATGQISHEQYGKAAILAACVVVHLALGFWMAHSRPEARGDAGALEVHFISRSEPAPPPVPVPAFPQAPTRPQPMRATPQRRATPSAPPDSPTLPGTQTPADVLQAPPSAARLLNAASAAAQSSANSAMPIPRDPTQRYAPRLAGREEPYTPHAIQLRKEISPQDVVKMIGRLFGANYQPCPDTRQRIHDITQRNEPIDEAELHRLIDRERRRCG